MTVIVIVKSKIYVEPLQEKLTRGNYEEIRLDKYCTILNSVLSCLCCTEEDEDDEWGDDYTEIDDEELDAVKNTSEFSSTRRFNLKNCLLVNF